MSSHTQTLGDPYDWKPQPQAAELVEGILDTCCRRSSTARKLREDLHHQTGTRLVDWVDHFAAPVSEAFGPGLSASGFVSGQNAARVVWRHPGGVLPEIEIVDRPKWRVAIKVDSVTDFLHARRIERDVPVEGVAGGPLRKAMVASEDRVKLWVLERHGYCGWHPPAVTPERIEAALRDDAISEEQAERFRNSGAIGSHLEILQRRQGYKGFNKAGINEIIRDTDPRHCS